MYVCVYVCMFACMCVCVFMYACGVVGVGSVTEPADLYVCVCMYECMYVCMCGFWKPAEL
jgi:hypothetical protein